MMMENDRPDRQDQLARLATLPDDCIDIPEAVAEAWRHAHQPMLPVTALAVEELDDATLNVLAASRMDARHDRLDKQMDANR